MLKKLLLAVCLVFGLYVSSACAADIVVKWDASPGATGYHVCQSVDLGVTWGGCLDVSEITTTVTVPDSGLVLIRASAYNNNGEAIRSTSGVWYNGDWVKPDEPTGVGVE